MFRIDRKPSRRMRRGGFLSCVRDCDGSGNCCGTCRYFHGKGGDCQRRSGDCRQTGDAALLRQKYAESLRDLIRLHEFPNGVPADTSFVEGDDFSGNQFAVCDIDQDGTEELLISYQDASMAGMVLYVFQYDAGTDAFTTELAEFPSVRFYSNGYVAADSSHNQGKGGKFWPYTIYRYDQDTDVYERVAYIDAGRKKCFPTDSRRKPM